MKLCFETSQINKFKNLKLGIDVDEKHNRVGLTAIMEKEHDGYLSSYVIWSDTFEIPEHLKEDVCVIRK